MKYNDVEDLVYRMHLTYDEFITILGINYIPQKERAIS